MAPTEVFLDASYAIALAVPSDRMHDRAMVVAAELRGQVTRIVTTRAVLLEIGNFLAKRRYRSAASRILLQAEMDRTLDILPLSDDLYARALALYRMHDDKEWGLTDCVSFVVMRERGLTHALTADEHFRQAGFVPMLAGG